MLCSTVLLILCLFIPYEIAKIDFPALRNFPLDVSFVSCYTDKGSRKHRMNVTRFIHDI